MIVSNMQSEGLLRLGQLAAMWAHQILHCGSLRRVALLDVLSQQLDVRLRYTTQLARHFRHVIHLAVVCKLLVGIEPDTNTRKSHEFKGQIFKEQINRRLFQKY